MAEAYVIQADARRLPLPDGSVDLIVTSPPYFALRSYRDGGEHYDGQIGSEPTPTDFIDALLECMGEWCRVLKPSGSVFVNLGDKYAGSNGQSGGASQLSGATYDPGGGRSKAAKKGGYVPSTDIRPKSLMGVPWRFAIACIDTGWILRAEIVWSKPNGLPESVTDRVRRSHEQWFHFVKEPRYYSAVDELREPQTGTAGWNRKPVGPAGLSTPESREVRKPDHPLGRLPGSVWEIPTEPLVVPAELGLPDHFAAFPQEWPRRIITGWSPPGICQVCGQGLVPATEVERERVRALSLEPSHGGANGLKPQGGYRGDVSRTIIGYACACPTPGPTTPAVVLDPFGGTGTTAGVARALGRTGISIDLSHDYSRLARWRIFESGHFQKTVVRQARDAQQELPLW